MSILGSFPWNLAWDYPERPFLQVLMSDADGGRGRGFALRHRLTPSLAWGFLSSLQA